MGSWKSIFDHCIDIFTQDSLMDFYTDFLGRPRGLGFMEMARLVSMREMLKEELAKDAPLSLEQVDSIVQRVASLNRKRSIGFLIGMHNRGTLNLDIARFRYVQQEGCVRITRSPRRPRRMQLQSSPPQRALEFMLCWMRLGNLNALEIWTHGRFAVRSYAITQFAVQLRTLPQTRSSQLRNYADRSLQYAVRRNAITQFAVAQYSPARNLPLCSSQIRFAFVILIAVV
jgi:hypothetical protein